MESDINQISANIYQKSFRGGANKVSISTSVFEIVKTLEYRKIEDVKHKLSGKYDIEIDDTLPSDKLYVSRVNFPMDLFYINDKWCGIHSQSNELEKVKTMKNIRLNIITPEMLIGEITIINYKNIITNV